VHAAHAATRVCTSAWMGVEDSRVAVESILPSKQRCGAGAGGGVSAASWPPGARPLRQLRIWRPGSLLSPERVMVMPWFFLSFPFLSE
jgi:hypothetical protein